MWLCRDAGLGIHRKPSEKSKHTVACSVEVYVLMVFYAFGASMTLNFMICIDVGIGRTAGATFAKIEESIQLPLVRHGWKRHVMAKAPLGSLSISCKTEI